MFAKIFFIEGNKFVAYAQFFVYQKEKFSAALRAVVKRIARSLRKLIGLEKVAGVRKHFSK